MVESARAHLLHELRHLVAAADAQEHNIGMAPQPLGSGQDSVEFVGATEISGIADHEFIAKSPLSAQQIVVSVNRHNRFVLAPVSNHLDVVAGDAAGSDLVRHKGADHNISGGGFETA